MLHIKESSSICVCLTKLLKLVPSSVTYHNVINVCSYKLF